MASVSSLDKDLRKLRLEKFTPAAASEARAWIESLLGEKLPSSDLLEGLKDGVALCKLINLILPPPGVRFKQSAMPFVQMENISIFLRACQAPPLNLHQHDTFLTVDLYEQKDPAQVLQCLGAFSRAAHAANPNRVPTVIGPKSTTSQRASVVSPQRTGPNSPGPSRDSFLRERGTSVTSNTSSSAYATRSILPHRTGDSASGGRSPAKGLNDRSDSSASVSTWSKKEHQGTTAPAWNIAQYGYIGGASQGNLGITFGSRRQITDSGPSVPSLAAKERMRREKEAEDERLRQEAVEAERRRQSELEAEEERARLEEERTWEQETRRQREDERRRVEEEKRRWEEEERQWRLTEEKRRQAEVEAEARAAEERRNRTTSDPRLRGQFLSQYQADQDAADDERGYKSRVKELEKELELARQREAEYERERQGRLPNSRSDNEARSKARSRSRPADNTPSRQDSWSKDEREILHTNRTQHRAAVKASAMEPLTSPPSEKTRSPGWYPDVAKSPRPLPETRSPRPSPRPLPETTSPRPLPEPTMRTPEPPHSPRPLPETRSPRPLPEPTFSSPHMKPQTTGGRPLPDPACYTSPQSASKPRSPMPEKYSSPPTLPTRNHPPAENSSPFTSGSPARKPRAPIPDKYNSPISRPDSFNTPRKSHSREPSTTTTPQHQTQQPPQQQQPAASAAATRPGMSLLEREMELERQRQREWEEAQKETAAAVRSSEGVDGVGGKWDVSQWSGFTGGDGGNKGNLGIGGGRRQIVGPRPPPAGGSR